MSVTELASTIFFITDYDYKMTVLNELKQKLSQLNIDAFIVGSGDAHQSEYVHNSDMRRAYISEFDGSAGIYLIRLFLVLTHYVQ